LIYPWWLGEGCVGEGNRSRNRENPNEQELERVMSEGGGNIYFMEQERRGEPSP
jgi:hypothetical protein